ncbi:hypothetical protein BCV70DRAFT_4787 [Testicularia cyperi]|uniref:Pre-rRNA-processing protein RIX1 N-terminal domain-containing protein n=1 Tax=Testicularia cyperi TaxID=1882483 RepID=A0A317XWL1_9BASI|nr:hypothetical protein BCV70DRAFT_4787 [Testicularia cyperi]
MVMTMVEPSAGQDVVQQLELLLTPVANQSLAQQETTFQLISQLNLLHTYPSREYVHKLVTRINSLISAQNVAGYRIAHLWLQQNPSVWNDHLVNHAGTWITQILNLVAIPTKLLSRQRPDALISAALELCLAHIFTDNSSARQEFHRQVVTPNLPKLVAGLTQLLEHLFAEQDADEATLGATITYTTRLLHVHPAQFRSVSARLHSIVSDYLYSCEEQVASVALFTSASHLLTALHLTGALAAKGSEASGSASRTTFAQLWQSTLNSHLACAAQAWQHAVSSFQDATSSAATEQIAATRVQGLRPFPRDPIDATRLAHARLDLFLGSRSHPGLIGLHLRVPTPRPVPVPVGTLLSFALDILHVLPTARTKPSAEAKVCIMQAAQLPLLHTRALALVAQLALVAPKPVALRASSLLTAICNLISGPDASTSPRVKVAAFRTLALLVGKHGVAMSPDPAGRTTLRLARVSVQQIANAVLRPDSHAATSARETPDTKKDGSNGSRKAKKARLYESDSVLGSTVNPKDLIQKLTAEEIAATQAALLILGATFPLLVTGLGGQHADLSQLTLHVTLALVEVLSDSVSSSPSQLLGQQGAPTTRDLLQSAIASLGELCLEAPSSMLATSLPRVLPLLSEVARGGAGGDPLLRSASSTALLAAEMACRGKFVPVARGVGFGSAARSDFEALPETSKLAGSGGDHTISMETDRGLDRCVETVLGAGAGSSGTKRSYESHDDDDDDDDEAEAGVSGKAGRVDVEAVAAESAELHRTRGVGEASAGKSHPQTPGGLGLGLGLPPTSSSSPSLSTSGAGGAGASRQHLSPDPVKPTHRPTTPRIGSPSSLHNRASLSAMSSRQASPTHSWMLERGQAVGVGLGGSTSTSTTSSAPAALVGTRTHTHAAITSTSTGVDSVANAAESYDNDDDDDEDDDDEEMPQIDMRSSDDESDDHDE